VKACDVCQAKNALIEFVHEVKDYNFYSLVYFKGILYIGLEV
jgi:hypothetical protein